MAYKNGKDLITYLQNHYLSSDDGKALIKSVFVNDPDIHDAIMKQLDIHTTIMNSLNKVALGDETPLIPQPGTPVNAPVKKA